jgi:hypothetical protein
LAFSLQQIAWQANAQRIVRAEIQESFQGRGLIDEIEIDFASTPIAVNATILTPAFRPEAEVEIENTLQTRLGQPVELVLKQFQVDTGSTAAEQAQLSSVRASEEADAAARADDLAKRLALVAGVPEDDVLVDRTRRRAMVRAERLDGASLAAYRTLELRIAATEPDWTIELLPPVVALPDVIAFEEDGPTAAGARALTVIEWASKRIDLPIVLIGNSGRGTQAAQILASRGVDVTLRQGTGPLRAEWGEPGE